MTGRRGCGLSAWVAGFLTAGLAGALGLAWTRFGGVGGRGGSGGLTGLGRGGGVTRAGGTGGAGGSGFASIRGARDRVASKRDDSARRRGGSFRGKNSTTACTISDTATAQARERVVAERGSQWISIGIVPGDPPGGIEWGIFAEVVCGQVNRTWQSRGARGCGRLLLRRDLRRSVCGVGCRRQLARPLPTSSGGPGCKCCPEGMRRVGTSLERPLRVLRRVGVGQHGSPSRCPSRSRAPFWCARFGSHAPRACVMTFGDLGGALFKGLCNAGMAIA